MRQPALDVHHTLVSIPRLVINTKVSIDTFV